MFIFTKMDALQQYKRAKCFVQKLMLMLDFQIVINVNMPKLYYHERELLLITDIIRDASNDAERRTKLDIFATMFEQLVFKLKLVAVDPTNMIKSVETLTNILGTDKDVINCLYTAFKL